MQKCMPRRSKSFGETSGLPWRFRAWRLSFISSQSSISDGRIICDLDDGVSFAREQESRPGVDQRDEVLHRIERAQSDESPPATAHAFVRWLKKRPRLFALTVGAGECPSILLRTKYRDCVHRLWQAR